MLRKKYGDQVAFTYINISETAGRQEALDRGLRLGTPQLIFQSIEGELIRQWHGPVTFKEVEPTFIELLVESS